MRSLLVKDLKVCAECGTTENVETHHCIHGTSGRKLATRYHLLVGLCPECHRGTNGVHGKNGHELDLKYKRLAQEKFEEKYGHDKWMEVFQKNYL
jgi:5-methylcytosine-specific restriction endonuclease McrA